MLFVIVLVFLSGCSPQLKTCEGVDASKCLSIIDICKNDRSHTFACRVSLLNEYCKLSEERLVCASRNLKVTVPHCRGDKDVSSQCLLAVKEVLDGLVQSCSGPGVMPQACAWLTTTSTGLFPDEKSLNISDSTSRVRNKSPSPSDSGDSWSDRSTTPSTTTATRKKRKFTTTAEPQEEEDEVTTVEPTTTTTTTTSIETTEYVETTSEVAEDNATTQTPPVERVNDAIDIPL